MIHFQHETTFQVLPFSAILTHSWTQEKVFLPAQMEDEGPILAATIP